MRSRIQSADIIRLLQGTSVLIETNVGQFKKNVSCVYECRAIYNSKKIEIIEKEGRALRRRSFAPMARTLRRRRGGPRFVFKKDTDL